MTYLRLIFAWLSRWIDDVAQVLSRAGGMFRGARKAQLVEQGNGDFLIRRMRRRGPGTSIASPLRIAGGLFVGKMPPRARALLTGGEVEILLKPSRFIFRPLELPKRALEFLDGVVRAQIDRLTPWSANDAAFGWSPPAPLGADRIVVTIAATSRALIAPLVEAVAGHRADAILVSTHADEAQAKSAPILVFARRSGAALRVRRLRRILIGILAVAVVAALASLAAAFVLGGDLDARRVVLEQRIAERRVALLSGRGSVADEALAALESRKRSTPAGVIVLETLSQTLPDDTFLNELRIEDGKVQISGLTRDAPALIRLIEQSRHFTHATFYAPTTRSPTENAERFHIEARIEPVFPVPL